jgi:hypothetical protein
VAEPQAQREQGERPRRSRSRLRGALSQAPRWAKQLGAAAVGAAAVAGGVVAVLSYEEHETALSVHIGPPEWVERNVTLGSFRAWQNEESRELRPRVLDGAASAPMESGPAAEAEVKPGTIRLASDSGASSAESGSSGVETGSPLTSTTSETGESSTEPSETITGSAAPAGGGPDAQRSLLAQTLGESAGRLNTAERARLEKRVKGQEEVLADTKLQASGNAVRTCSGVGYGGCSPADPAVEVPVVIEGPHGTGSTATQGTFTSTNESLTQAPPGQSKQELIELADNTRQGRATDANLVPPMLTAGLSPFQRAHVVSMLGDAVALELHTKGWVNQQLWLTWTMYEKHEGQWNPSSREYLIDQPDAYLVPKAADDEDLLTFWFPIPREPGEYQVRYFIRAPGGKRKLATGKTHVFHSYS